jgi:ubiquinone/menaquinone biosynthesis C-methylase UbiE
MRLTRNVTLLIHALLDQCLPPLVRDSRLFMLPLFRLLFGKKARLFMDFKEMASSLDRINMQTIYKEAAPCSIRRATDLNKACLRRIEREVLGGKVLDIACGRGFLAKRLSRTCQVTAADIQIQRAHFTESPWISLAEADILRLPFADRSFDTVVCTHTLEHVLNIPTAIAELRRVTAQRLIIVVPRQRPYKFTFDLHLHFFPYVWSLQLALGRSGESQQCELVGGDWYFVEQR